MYLQYLPIKLRFTRVPMSYPMIVLEMNNTTNKIEGMGFYIERDTWNILST